MKKRPDPSKRMKCQIVYLDLRGQILMRQPVPQRIMNSLIAADAIQQIALKIGEHAFAIDRAAVALSARAGRLVVRQMDPNSDFELQTIEEFAK